MKKLFVILIAVAAGGAANAQKVYVQGGLNLANISKNDAGETNDRNTLATFNAGAMVQFGISKVFDIETGLLFTGRGAKSNTYYGSNQDDNYIKAKFNPYYVELPVNAVVKFPLSTDGKSSIFVNAGPYVAVGVAGKSQVETKFLGVTTTSSESIKFNDDDPTTSGQEGARYDRLKRFDYGLNFGAGIDLGTVLLKANYGLGLAKISSLETNNSDNDKNKYRTLSISVGIPLGR
jgi:hypothetical protein